MKSQYFPFYPICFSLLILLGISCTKSPESKDILHHSQEDPLMSALNIDVLFSDSGKIEARLTSPLFNRYGGATPYLDFPKGFKIYMFDSLQHIVTTISGNRGIRKEYTRTMEAWGNVIVRNEKKQEQLNTEHLVWEENLHRIWTDVKVKITTPDKILYGDRMESNEAFTDYTIFNPRGQMDVKKDSI